MKLVVVSEFAECLCFLWSATVNYLTNIISFIRGFVHPSVSPSVCWSVRPSVCPSVGPSVRQHESKSEKTRISALAHPSVTDGRVSSLVLYVSIVTIFYHFKKPYIYFKSMWLLNKCSDHYEILHAKIADQDLFETFFRIWLF